MAPPPPASPAAPTPVPRRPADRPVAPPTDTPTGSPATYPAGVPPAARPPAARPARKHLAGLRSAGQVARATVAKAWDDRILGLSAETAFWQLLSVPPLFLALLAAVGFLSRFFGPETLVDVQRTIVELSGEVVSPQVVDSVIAPVSAQILGGSRPDVISLGLVLALWAGSSSMATFVNTVTIAYGQRDKRGAVRSRLLALLLYLLTVAAGAVVLPLLVIGPGLTARAVPDSWDDATQVVIHVAYWPVLGLMLFLGLAALYHWATPIRLRWRRAYPGAALAMVLFAIFSYLLQLYVSAVFTSTLVYSTLAAPILALLYFYFLAMAVLLGAELNATLETLWPGGPRETTLARMRRRLFPAAPAAQSPGDSES